ncbi:hypothetical protein [Pseudozobellia thermophila]|uniref:Holin-X, holin superfamily III n=1 Tax=Pseudozobellia thermophila TaxID=192903 RepID=A0A1M6BIQ7_9FLAO|nr:hypothetical protein [Pseudozobellia thermophila]SHI48478.1 hypothetical protein SAMN04488513_101437 [Pseudozobellia thermophila]
MAFEEMERNLSDAEVTARAYIDNSLRYYKLKVFKLMMRSIGALIKMASVSILLVLALSCFSVGAALGIGVLVGSNAMGFVLVGSGYVLVGILLYFIRDRVDKPLLKKFSEFYFEEL